MAAIQVQCTDSRSTRLLLELFQRSADGGADTLLRRGVVAAATAVTVNTAADQYLVVSDFGDNAGKSVDNW
jgi:hypothetical protein